ncbi:MAG: sulfite exporter TauE/SafE family protein [Saprospiraceae bacterium]|nr:sulfite exporter TauE/SafE family protein [Saprospiraceae bacterium]
MNVGLWFVFLSGLGVGIAGSLHCIGMCGPLVIAAAGRINSSSFHPALSMLVYHLSRVMAYVAIGVIMGIIGKGLSLVILQQWISIFIGIFLLFYLFILQNKFDSNIQALKPIVWLKNKIGTMLSGKKNLTGMAQLGFLNGWLPCGLVYMAAMLSIASGSLVASMVLMLGFGLATIPLLIVLMILGNVINYKFRKAINKLSPVIMIVMVFIFLLRGMNLGIPYLSPKLDSKALNCCEKASH